MKVGPESRIPEPSALKIECVQKVGFMFPMLYRKFACL